MKSLLPIAEKIAARLKERKRNARRCRVVCRWSHLRGARRAAGRISLLRRRHGRLHARVPPHAARDSRRGCQGNPRLHRALRASRRPRDPRTPRSDLGHLGERRVRPDRESLWRSAGPRVHRGQRGRRARTDDRDKPRRPCGEHARLRGEGARAPRGLDRRLTLSHHVAEEGIRAHGEDVEVQLATCASIAGSTIRYRVRE